MVSYLGIWSWDYDRVEAGPGAGAGPGPGALTVLWGCCAAAHATRMAY